LSVTSDKSKEKVQKDKQRCTKHTHATKDRVSGTSIKPGGELWCSGRVSIFVLVMTLAEILLA